MVQVILVAVGPVVVAVVSSSSCPFLARSSTWRRELWGLFFVTVLDEILAHFCDGLLYGSEEYVSMY